MLQLCVVYFYVCQDMSHNIILMNELIQTNKQRKRKRHKPTMPRINTLKNQHNHIHTQYKHKGNKWQKFYGTRAWRDLRDTKLMNQPLCERCLEHDKITPATTAHHRKVFGDFIDDNDKWYWFLNYDNLVSLCDKCHKEIHNGLTANEDTVWIEHQ